MRIQQNRQTTLIDSIPINLPRKISKGSKTIRNQASMKYRQARREENQITYMYLQN